MNTNNSKTLACRHSFHVRCINVSEVVCQPVSPRESDNT